MPFFLYRTGSAAASAAGFPSFFAFWMGGAGFNSGTAAVTDWLVRARRRGRR